MNPLIQEDLKLEIKKVFERLTNEKDILKAGNAENTKDINGNKRE